jgi:hypothetical protein
LGRFWSITSVYGPETAHALTGGRRGELSVIGINKTIIVEKKQEASLTKKKNRKTI